MHRRQLNWADLNGLLAVPFGVLGGIVGSLGRDAHGPLLALSAACGLLVGVVSAKGIGRVAYGCLDRADGSTFSFVGYILVSVTAPVVAFAALYTISAVLLGGATAA